MDHMRISGTEPSSVILNQKSSFKNLQKVPKQAEAIRNGVIKPINYNFNQLNATNQTKSIGYMCHWSTGSDTHQVVEI